MSENLWFTMGYATSPGENESTKNSGFICDALRDLVPFVQFRKREKHLWRSVTFNKVAG